MNDVTRMMVVWVPDWPVRAHALAVEISPDSPLAVVDRGLVFACSAAARAEGVRRGQRIRESRAKCPGLLALDYDEALDHRSFEPIVSALEALMPGVQVLRPGMCALRARGPSRYYGGERQAAQVVLNTLASLYALTAEGGSTPAARIAIADGRFAAEQATRMPGWPEASAPVVAQGPTPGPAPIIRIVPPGGSPAFLAPQPIEAIGDPALATLLRRLGMPTLGDFAALDFRDVRARFAEAGVHAHTLASGSDVRRVVPRLPPQLRDVEMSFEPPLELVDQITFAFRTAAERFVAELTQALLVCTSILVELHTENGAMHERSWGHPRWFSASDVVDRIRWQVQGRTGAGNGALGSAITKVRVVPQEFDSIGNYEAGLWGSTPDDRVHHGLSRVQSLLGHEGVVTASIGGGRGLAERQVLVPWGDAVVAQDAAGQRAAGQHTAGAAGRPRAGAKGAVTKSAAARVAGRVAGPKGAGASAAAPKGAKAVPPPWPGAVPLPAPSTVFERPQAVTVRGAGGESITVSQRGVLSGIPNLFLPVADEPGAPVERLRPLEAWAGPWPVQERWWDAEKARAFHRFQVVDASGTAWLLALHDRRWWAEARYD
ncbi:DNA polymerase Y family protein [Subtercola endophyticus]|uniref:DNA polymerase Y family protein n=1 Tax=Subtercola endophyticus TaxID=2895559 RepID=UPI001E3816E2|nr:DNA polymerase Y family protein [Subtercola endophyticus]UFS60320.1 DNA polymerase Y family protein [Subtercola endophyticus]